MSRVLVIGGAGFIGSNTSLRLVKEGYDVTVLDNLDPGTHKTGKPPHNIISAVEDNYLRFVQDTLFNTEVLVEELKKADYVFHLAAFQDYKNQFSTYVKANVESTALIYETIVTEKLTNIKRVVVAGSQAVYGEGVYICNCSDREPAAKYPRPRKEVNLSLGIYDPECPSCGKFLKCPDKAWSLDMLYCVPTSIYSLSKRQQVDTALFLGEKYNIETVALNYSIVQGPWQSPYNLYSGLLRNVIVADIHKVNPVLFEDGGQLRDYVHIDDVVDANIAALKLESFKAYNVCGKEQVTNWTYTQNILRELGSKLEPELPGYYRVGDTKNALSRSSTNLFKPHRSISQMIKDTINWYDNYVETKSLPNPKDVLNKMLETGTVQKVNKYK